MMGNRNPLPKGMTLPQMSDHVKPKYLTHEDVNYSVLIREALAKIPGISINITKLSVEESCNGNPLMELHLELNRLGDEND